MREAVHGQIIEQLLFGDPASLALLSISASALSWL
jgi:hypothetical protein